MFLTLHTLIVCFKWSELDYVRIPEIKRIFLQIQLLPKLWDISITYQYLCIQ